MYEWNGQSWRKYLVVNLKKIKVKRSSDKFVLEIFITVFLAARSSEETTDWAKFQARDLRYILCVLIEEKVCMEMKVYQLAWGYCCLQCKSRLY